MFYRTAQNSVKGMFVVKLNFGFGGMYIDINTLWIHLQKKKITGVSFIFQQAIKGSRNGMIEIRTFNKTIIHKKELLSPALFGKFGFAYKAVDLYDTGFFLHRHEFFIGLSAKNI